MAIRVPPYGPSYDFAGDPSPQNMINSAALQVELARISSWAADLSAMFAELIRSDDTLEDVCIRLRHLHPEVANYIESKLEGNLRTQALEWRPPVRGATNVNQLALASTINLDGITYVSGDVILLLGQTNKAQNGPWKIAALGDPGNPSGLWTRPTWYPTGLPVAGGWGVMVRSGTTLGGSAWSPLLPTSGGSAVVDTDPVDFQAIFGPYPLPISKGGTGASTVAGAVAALGVPRKAVVTITGDGTTANFFVAHPFASYDVLVGVRTEAAPKESVGVTTRPDSTAEIELIFATPPALGEVLKVTMIG